MPDTTLGPGRQRTHAGLLAPDQVPLTETSALAAMGLDPAMIFDIEVAALQRI